MVLTMLSNSKKFMDYDLVYGEICVWLIVKFQWISDETLNEAP